VNLNYVEIVWEAVTGTSLAYLAIKAANSQFIDDCNDAPLRLPEIQNRKLLSLH